jgi:SAM domain (Sterile alpha motif)
LDIDGWLRRIGLEQYAQTFRDNAIDADLLGDLTDEHLRELALPLGARIWKPVLIVSKRQIPLAPRAPSIHGPEADISRIGIL